MKSYVVSGQLLVVSCLLLTACQPALKEDEVILEETEMATPLNNYLPLEEEDVELEEAEHLDGPKPLINLDQDGEAATTPTPKPKKIQLDPNGNFVEPQTQNAPYLNEAGEYVVP